MRVDVPACSAAALILALAAGCSQPASPPKGTVAPVDVAGPPPDAVVTATGLAFRVLVRGPGGRRPGPEATIFVNYTGWTTDGTIIEGAPVGEPAASFQLNEMMPGWQEGVRRMSAGDKWRFWIPGPLAYGYEPGRPHGMLVYDISLVRFID